MSPVSTSYRSDRADTGASKDSARMAAQRRSPAPWRTHGRSRQASTLPAIPVTMPDTSATAARRSSGVMAMPEATSSTSPRAWASYIMHSHSPAGARASRAA